MELMDLQREAKEDEIHFNWFCVSYSHTTNRIPSMAGIEEGVSGLLQIVLKLSVSEKQFTIRFQCISIGDGPTPLSIAFLAFFSLLNINGSAF